MRTRLIRGIGFGDAVSGMSICNLLSSIQISPESGFSSRATQRATVDLPEPDSPTSAKVLPGRDFEIHAIDGRAPDCDSPQPASRHNASKGSRTRNIALGRHRSAGYSLLASHSPYLKQFTGLEGSGKKACG